VSRTDVLQLKLVVRLDVFILYPSYCQPSYWY